MQAITSQATLAGEPQRISGVSIRFQTANTYNINDDIAAAKTVKSTGQLDLDLAHFQKNAPYAYFRWSQTIAYLTA